MCVFPFDDYAIVEVEVEVVEKEKKRRRRGELAVCCEAVVRNDEIDLRAKEQKSNERNEREDVSAKFAAE